MEPGWRAVLADGEEEDAAPLAPLVAGANEAEGVAVGTEDVHAEAEETKPPARITEARLLSLMENAGRNIEDEDLARVMHDKGLGTPATRAEVIENLIAKDYVLRVGKVLRPTTKGIRLIDTLRRIHVDRLASAQLTGEIEQHLGQVEIGGRTAADFMSEMARVRERDRRAREGLRVRGALRERGGARQLPRLRPAGARVRLVLSLRAEAGQRAPAAREEAQEG